MNHFSFTRLQEYADGLLNKTISEEIALHVRTCHECNKKMEVLKSIELSIRKIPLENASDDFTERVMNRLGVERVSGFAWEVLKTLAPVISLAFLSGVIYAVFHYTGMFRDSDVQHSVKATESVYNSISNNLFNGVTGFNSLIGKYIPFANQKEHYWLTAFLVLLFGAVALLDKYIVMPTMRKRG